MWFVSGSRGGSKLKVFPFCPLEEEGKKCAGKKKRMRKKHILWFLQCVLVMKCYLGMFPFSVFSLSVLSILCWVSSTSFLWTYIISRLLFNCFNKMSLFLLFCLLLYIYIVYVGKYIENKVCFYVCIFFSEKGKHSEF